MLGVVTCLALAGVLAGIVVTFLVSGSEPDRPVTNVPATGSPAAPGAPGRGEGGISVSATCVHAPSRDSAGRPTSYEPWRAVDGVVDTAWRCDGEGVGQEITITFTDRVRLSRVGVIPGLAKTDPHDGTDRYAQNRRISTAIVRFDTGYQADLTLDTSAGDRSMQYLSLGRDLTVGSITVSIASSVPGQAVGQFAPVDSVAISEIGWE